MELSLRALKESDWDILLSWWKWWRWPELSKDVLPMDGTGGLMVYKGDTLIAAGFLYLTNSKAAWLDWIVSNPNYREYDRKDSLALLIDGLEAVAKSEGCNTIISITRNKSLIDIHNGLGYTIDKNPSYEISKKII
jgi:hypothetical protein